jgi:glyoxylase-like metal-dependent hydrolase (beta-lactamase superfamily II)
VSLVVDRYVLGPVQTNCYVVRAERGAREAVVVDPGADAAQLRLELARIGATCAAILITHTHFDHIGAVADLAEASGAPVHVPQGEAAVLARADEIYRGYGVIVRPWSDVVPVAGDEELDLGGIAWQTLSVPGHSPDHVAYYADGNLFSGDVVFQGGVGRVDLPGGDWDTLLESIRTLADRFPPETVVHSGHGGATTLGDELARNPFLAELRAS